MKFFVDKHSLVDAVGKAARALPTRPAVPVLAGLRLAVADGVLTVTATDYDQTITATCEAQIDAPGVVVVHGRLLADIAKALPAGNVVFELDGSKVLVTAGAARFTLLTMPVDDYPPIPAVPETVTELDLDVLEGAVGRVGIAATRDQTLPLLTCVNLVADGEQLALRATDRYRLASDVIEWGDGDFKALLPSAALLDAVKILTGPVRVGLADGKVSFSTDTESVVLNVFDGDFPPVMRLFSQETPITAKVDRDQLVSVVKRVALVAERNTPVKFDFGDGVLTVSAGTGDDSQAVETLPVEVSEPITTAYNPQFLLDGLGCFDPGDVVFGFTEGMKPAVLSQDNAFRYLVMPVRFGA